MTEEKSKFELDGLNFTEDEIIIFENGLPGFNHLKRFVISSTPEQEPFHWLHSLDNPGVRFVLVNPLMIREDYSPKVSKPQMDALKVQKVEDLLTYVIVTLNQEQMALSTVNLAGPLFINIRERIGVQYILEDRRYSVREPIFEGGS